MSLISQGPSRLRLPALTPEAFEPLAHHRQRVARARAQQGMLVLGSAAPPMPGDSTWVPAKLPSTEGREGRRWLHRVGQQPGPVGVVADHRPLVPVPFRGNLFTRTLSDIVSKEDFVLDSEYLITLLVIVPKYVGRKGQEHWPVAEEPGSPSG